MEYMLHFLPNATVIKDVNHNPTKTWVRMLSAAGASPALFLEDDVLLCDGFLEHVEAIVKEHGESVINFFDARLNEPGYQPGREFASNLCYWLPAGYAARIAHFSATWPGHDDDHLLDWITRDFLKANGLQFYQVCPGLVDHRVGPSAIKPRRPVDRRGVSFRGE